MLLRLRRYEHLISDTAKSLTLRRRLISGVHAVLIMMRASVIIEEGHIRKMREGDEGGVSS